MTGFTIMGKNDRAWGFDPAGAAYILRSSHYNRELLRRSELGRVIWGGGLLPCTTYQVETDFTGIRDEVNRLAQASARQFDDDVRRDPQGLYEFLVGVRKDGEKAGEAHRAMLRDAAVRTALSLEGDVDFWENKMMVAKFVRDVSAGALFVGATVLSGGMAPLALAAGTGITFFGNLEDNLIAGQTHEQAVGNARIATAIAVVTNVLIPVGGAAIASTGRWVSVMKGTTKQLSGRGGVALGLVYATANTAGDVAKTAFTGGVSGTWATDKLLAAFKKQAPSRMFLELVSSLFQAWLQTKGIPASARIKSIQDGPDQVSSLTGGMLNAVTDRVVAAITQQSTPAAPNVSSAVTPAELDMIFADIAATMGAEEVVRRVAMCPIEKPLPGPVRVLR